LKATRRDPQPQAHRPRPRVGTGEQSGKGVKARRPAPVTTARASASRRSDADAAALPEEGFQEPLPQGSLCRQPQGSRGPLPRTIDVASLHAAGLVPRTSHTVKILAQGEVTKKFVVKASAFSGSAKEKIEKAGGTAEVVAD